MKIYRNVSDFSPLSNTAVTTGTFDGVHCGHKVILNRLRNAAASVNGSTVLITFDPHPRMVLHPEANTDLKLLNTTDEKIALLEKEGIDHLVIIPFTRQFAETTGEEYIRDILVKRIGVRKLVIGYDHRFGKGRGASFKDLVEMAPEYGFEVEEIPALEIDDSAVSSTKIRKALLNGEIEKANEKLGYAYSISGLVVKGHQLGRTIQFPTANIQPLEPLKMIPARGVYAAEVLFEDKAWPAMVNIGTRPTFNGEEEKIEAHILNFEGDLYNKTISIRFITRIRDEQKFDSVDALKNQLQADRTKTLDIFKLTAY